jgi:recombination protein RecA
MRAKPSKKLDKLSALEKRFSGHQPAQEVYKVVRAVPTWFIQFDHATRVHGYPVERVTLCHGPSNEGKTALAVGLAGSFLSHDHFVNGVDAERTTDKVWVRKLIGDLVTHPRFKAIRPDSYEHAIANTREFAQNLIEAREAGEVSEDTVGFQFVDSMRKLVPKNLLDEILSESAPSGIKLQNRQAMRQAQANAAWLDELVPLADKAGIGYFLIAREIEDPDADDRARKSGNAFKVGGGKALRYDSSFQIRVQLAGYTYESTTKGAPIIGERHKCTVYKTKIGEKEGRGTVFHFHTSRGILTPYGFDRARDVLELAVKFGVVRLAGSSYSFGGKRVGVGENNAVKSLSDKPEMLRDLEAATREKFAEHKPEEEGEEVEAAQAASSLFKSRNTPPHDPETGEVLE